MLSDIMHHADVFHCHWWLRGRVVAAGGAHYRDAGAVDSELFFERADDEAVVPLPTLLSGRAMRGVKGDIVRIDSWYRKIRLFGRY
jgi:hypothetical protein